MNLVIIIFGGADMDIEITGSKLWMINFYKEQLRKFNKVGLGNKTENDVRVTQELIDITKKRLGEISVVYDANLSPDTLRFRKYRLQLAKRGINGQLIGNETAASESSKDIRTNGHEGSES